MKFAILSNLVIFSALALAQAPGGAHPPQPTQPIPPAATPPPSSPAQPAQPATGPRPTPPAPTTPPPPMVPLILHDPSDMRTLENLTKEESDLQRQINDFVAKVNATLGAWNDQMMTIQKTAQDNWGGDVVYNRQTGKFERPAGSANSAGKPEKKEVKP
jgi:hypothetical protein